MCTIWYLKLATPLARTHLFSLFLFICALKRTQFERNREICDQNGFFFVNKELQFMNALALGHLVWSWRKRLPHKYPIEITCIANHKNKKKNESNHQLANESGKRIKTKREKKRDPKSKEPMMKQDTSHSIERRRRKKTDEKCFLKWIKHDRFWICLYFIPFYLWHVLCALSLFCFGFYFCLYFWL